jgi:hypothetical protein
MRRAAFVWAACGPVGSDLIFVMTVEFSGLESLRIWSSSSSEVGVASRQRGPIFLSGGRVIPPGRRRVRFSVDVPASALSRLQPRPRGEVSQLRPRVGGASARSRSGRWPRLNRCAPFAAVGSMGTRRAFAGSSARRSNRPRRDADYRPGGRGFRRPRVGRMPSIASRTGRGTTIRMSAAHSARMFSMRRRASGLSSPRRRSLAYAVLLGIDGLDTVERPSDHLIGLTPHPHVRWGGKRDSAVTVSRRGLRGA